ncbi:MAG TPA: DUF2381 family protein [Archangium sp.]|uniref:DUF2381 family protein n=1 Tax=Archangium sp. TaxID=1872627 RepID=UPI002E32B6C0|nr:DUF2381 family protein [Archangium sp.]HEX5754073.1 DUF2381 family protein [Archangium sp.]
MAVAKGHEPVSRSLYLPDDPREAVHPVYVAGGMGTVLRFAQPVDPAKTKMLGWEGRFEPLLAGGHLVVVTPLKDLDPEDRFLLVVTLLNGKELPFTVTAQEARFDHQVNVFPDEESPEALRSRLAHHQTRERVLEEENERYRNEETSIDHALAALLAKGAVKMTSMRPKLVHFFKNPQGVEFLVTVLASKKDNKVAVVFDVKNNSPTESWSLLEARVVTEAGGEKKPFALRATQEYLAPGGMSGTIAVVMDAGVFDSKMGPERLVLELFRRGSGLREVWVLLDRQLLR